MECSVLQPPGSKDFVVGAGVIYDARGIVMTNYHVIEPIMKAARGPGLLRGGRLSVRFADGRERDAKVLLAGQVWEHLEAQYPHAIGPINPHNAEIEELFGEEVYISTLI